MYCPFGLHSPTDVSLTLGLGMLFTIFFQNFFSLFSTPKISISDCCNPVHTPSIKWSYQPIFVCGCLKYLWTGESQLFTFGLFILLKTYLFPSARTNFILAQKVFIMISCKPFQNWVAFVLFIFILLHIPFLFAIFFCQNITHDFFEVMLLFSSTISLIMPCSYFENSKPLILPTS